MTVIAQHGSEVKSQRLLEASQDKKWHMEQMLFWTWNIVFLREATTGLIAHLTEAKRVHPVLDRAPIDGSDLPSGIE